ncbi:alpha/beta hydrolase fold domain-containing protein [Rubritalea spongiae]|uniref:Alpha/beta hydrolase fold domain-containing protein n=1 Tax=Rubritalea spongiae TaxID=430797 RepID=A0ABW5E1K1_9BACT
MKLFHISIILASVLLASFTTAAEKKVAWEGESFLDVTYKQVGKRQIKLDIYKPKDSTSTKAPLLYYVHGGGWAAGDKAKGGLPLMQPVFKQVAEKGFVCVSTNYRLFNKNNGVIMKDCVTDAFDGLRFMIKNAEHYGIDPTRVVVWGDSAGGQLAQMLTLADSNRFKGDKDLAKYSTKPLAGISWYGPTDFTDVELFKTDLSDKNPDRFGFRITGVDGGFEKFPDEYKEMSPYYWLKKDSPPLFLLQGDTDATIPYAHAPHLKQKADEIGANVKTLIVKNAGHNWRKAGGPPEPSIPEIQQLTAEFAIQQVEDASK